MILYVNIICIVVSLICIMVILIMFNYIHFKDTNEPYINHVFLPTYAYDRVVNCHIIHHLQRWTGVIVFCVNSYVKYTIRR